MQIAGEHMPNFFLVLDLVFVCGLFDQGWLLGYFLFIISPSNPYIMLAGNGGEYDGLHLVLETTLTTFLTTHAQLSM